MDKNRLLILMIAFIIVGVTFIIAGLYFGSRGFLQAMADSHEAEDEKRHAVASGKLCGTISLGLGGLTIVSGIAIKYFPQMFHYMALLYVLALIACFAGLIFTFSKKK